MKAQRSRQAFTLIELLAVITIIGIISAVVGPALTKKEDAMAAATRQVLDDVARARQLAISQRTTIYMVFVGDNFWNAMLPANQNTTAVSNLLDKQLTGYTFVSLRSIGDQPGQSVPRFLASWRSLPETIYFAPSKFDLPNAAPFDIVDPPGSANVVFRVRPFERYSVPFPAEKFDQAFIPCIAFNYLGQLVSGRDEYIPLGHGSILYARNAATKQLQMGPPDVQDRPSGNLTNNYNVIRIDWLTGRARLERRELQ